MKIEGGREASNEYMVRSGVGEIRYWIVSMHVRYIGQDKTRHAIKREEYCLCAGAKKSVFCYEHRLCIRLHMVHMVVASR